MTNLSDIIDAASEDLGLDFDHEEEMNLLLRVNGLPECFGPMCDAAHGRGNFSNRRKAAENEFKKHIAARSA